MAKETREHEDAEADAALDRVRKGDVDVNRLVDEWAEAFSTVSVVHLSSSCMCLSSCGMSFLELVAWILLQEVIDYTKPDCISNDDMFSDVYHSLIHSSALETLLNLEHTHAMTVSSIIKQRDKDLTHLEQR